MTSSLCRRFTAAAGLLCLGAAAACGSAETAGRDERATEALPADPRPAPPRHLLGSLGPVAKWVAGDNPRWQCRFTRSPSGEPDATSDSARARQATLRAADGAQGAGAPSARRMRHCVRTNMPPFAFVVVTEGDTVLSAMRIQTDSAGGVLRATLAGLRKELEARAGAPTGTCRMSQPGPRGLVIAEVLAWRRPEGSLGISTSTDSSGTRLIVGVGAAAPSCPVPGQQS